MSFSLHMPSFSARFATSHLTNGFGRTIGAVVLIGKLSGARPASLHEWGAATQQGWRILRNLNVLKRFIYAIGSEIDDRVDPMPFREFQALGEVYPGTEPCPFLKNPKVVQPADWENFRRLDQAGIMPLSTITAFGNCLSEKVYAEKMACHYAEDDPQFRQDAKQAHLELCSLSLAFVAAIMNPAQRDRLNLHANELTHDFIVSAMPDLNVFGDVLQYHDDLCDLLRDQDEESREHCVSPNVTLATMAQGGSLETLEEFMAFKGRRLPREEFISVSRLPSVVRRGWTQSVEEVMARIDTVSDAYAAKCMRIMISAIPGPLHPDKSVSPA